MSVLTENHPPENYTRAWLLLAAAAVGIAILGMRVGRPPMRQAPPTPVTGETVDWFLLLRMPAVTAQYESSIDTMRIRYGEWLQGMRRDGFTPMRLSEVYRRLKDGRGVPPKTVVLVFEPGFRRTYNIIAPVLQENQWPAVWITPTSEMESGHREYLTYHRTRQMIASGWWDVGYMGKRGQFVLKTPDRTIHFGNETIPAWARTSGGTALNRGPVFGQMHRLHVLSDWTTDDLVNRMRVEVPISKPVYLTLASVQNLQWGLTVAPESTQEKHFDMTIPLWRRGMQVAWFGAKSYSNYDLTAEAEDLVGHLAFRLRWNESLESGIVVTASKRAWTIQQQSPSGTVMIKRFYRRRSPGFKLQMQLIGTTLTLSEDGRDLGTVLLPPDAPMQGGLIQLYLYDALKGSAGAHGLRLFFTPLAS